MFRKWLFFAAVNIILISPVWALVQPRGTDTTFDLITWNVVEFPGNGFRTIDTLAVLINDLNIDMMAMEEIADTSSFYQLLQRLPGWSGLFAPYDYPGSYLKTGLLWRTDRANVTYIEQLFIGNQFQFPRPPIHLQATVTFGQNQFDFHIIVLHLKALSDEESRLRRQAAILMLKAYLDNTIPNSPDQDWIVLGDYNDLLEDVQSENVFWPILIDSIDYRFLTLPMAGNPYWSSYPSFNSLIDHILISNDANYEFGSGTCITLRLDDEYSNYFYRISDHRPVMAQFIGYSTGISSEETIPERHTILSAYPNPFNNSTMLCYSLEYESNVKLELFDISGRQLMTILDEKKVAGEYQVRVDASGLSSGIYFAKLSGDKITSSAKLVLVK